MNTGDIVRIGPVSRIAFANGVIDFSGASHAAEVVRLYATILGREPDEAGMINWNDHMAHGMSLAQVAEGFFSSNEFITRFGGLTNEALVVNLYWESLGRLPDTAGMAVQLGALDAGLSRAQLIANFVQSPEAARKFEASHPGGLWVRDSNATVVGMAYDAVFDRTPDAVGLAFWTGKLARGELTARQLVEAIADSDEFRAHHAHQDDVAYVTSIYRSTLEREPDPEGLAHWVDHLAQQRMDRIDVVLLIGMSDEQREQFMQHPHGDAFLG
ncbi:DUF4214 domain-containing protein [Roseomonas marmotae]|uniref:DUF4214 domain-containing protein n=1 Tax=Roseomonas marmotae TaxID=2768161 RepID=UPI001A9668D9|nr:DUF4214 domain-containing protein [Roseomonas marmotae]QTI80594.1 DUF4214 domain-containing protein [Roseomonas marmotae]